MENPIPQAHLAHLDQPLHVAPSVSRKAVDFACKPNHLLTCVRLHTREQLLQVVNAFADELHVLQAVLGSLCPAECQHGRATQKPPNMHLQSRQTKSSACIPALLVRTAFLVTSTVSADRQAAGSQFCSNGSAGCSKRPALLTCGTMQAEQLVYWHRYQQARTKQRYSRCQRRVQAHKWAPPTQEP